MGSLTDNTPKPMLMVGAKNLIEHKLDALPPEIDEVIIIVGYLGHVIQKHFGGNYRGKRMLYIDQANIVGGTADALFQAKDILHDRFLVLNGDDIYAASDLVRMVAAEGWVVLGQRVSGTRSGGKLIVEGTEVTGIDEGTHTTSHLLNTNAFVLDTRVFSQAPVPKARGASELGLPQTVLAASLTTGVPLHAIETDHLIQITAPEDLAAAEFSLRTAA